MISCLTDKIAEYAETTFSSLSPPIYPIDGEYIREWLVLGPFFPDDLEKDFLADAGGETNIHPQEGDTIGFDTRSPGLSAKRIETYSTQATEDGRELTWQRYQTKGNIIALLEAIGDYKNATAYAFYVLQVERRRVE